MRIVFRKEASHDLRGIIDWYNDVGPAVVSGIVADIYRSIDQLTRYPRSGTEVPGRTFRRIVTLRYHFKIAYEVADNRVIILGIFRYQDKES